MVTKKKHILGVKSKRAKNSKRKINKKRQTFKINKYIRAKRRSKKNLKLSRIQKNQLIGGGVTNHWRPPSTTRMPRSSPTRPPSPRPRPRLSDAPARNRRAGAWPRRMPSSS